MLFFKKPHSHSKIFALPRWVRRPSIIHKPISAAVKYRYLLIHLLCLEHCHFKLQNIQWRVTEWQSNTSLVSFIVASAVWHSTWDTIGGLRIHHGADDTRCLVHCRSERGDRACLMIDICVGSSIIMVSIKLTRILYNHRLKYSWFIYCVHFALL